MRSYFLSFRFIPTEPIEMVPLMLAAGSCMDGGGDPAFAAEILTSES
jgi:hypothetical protein